MVNFGSTSDLYSDGIAKSSTVVDENVRIFLNCKWCFRLVMIEIKYKSHIRPFLYAESERVFQ